MPCPSNLRKGLALTVMFMLLTLPVVSITGDARLTSPKDCDTEVALTAHESDTGDFSLLKTEPELPLGGGLSLSERLHFVADSSPSSKKPHRTTSPPKEIFVEVPTPPNISC